MFLKNILITRSLEQAKKVEEDFIKKGFNVINFPVIKIIPLEFKIENIEKYEWIVFTSANAVKFFFQKINKLPKNIKIAVIGNKTAELVRNNGFSIDLLPKEFVSESLIDEFKKLNIKDKNILFPKALKGRDVLINELSKIGTNVDFLPVYKNEINIPENKESILNMLQNSKIDYIIFTSPSTINNFFKIIDINLIKNSKFICIGPITEKELLNYTNQNYFVSDEFSIKGIINKLLSLS